MHLSYLFGETAFVAKFFMYFTKLRFKSFGLFPIDGKNALLLDTVPLKIGRNFEDFLIILGPYPGKKEENINKHMHTMMPKKHGL